MDILDIQPIQNKPALFIKKRKIFVVADLHIGIESQLNERGIQTTDQSQKVIDSFLALCKKYLPKKIILLGDIKHNIPLSTYKERKDIKQFLEKIKQYGEVHIIPGNHDGNIDKFCINEILIHSSEGLVIENIGFVHGHRWPSEELMHCDQIIMAHTHPSIIFTDRLGHKSNETCWIKAKIEKKKYDEKYSKFSNPSVLIMPAFNPLCSGLAINKEGITGPFGKLINMKSMEAYLLDGVFLGLVKDIE